MLPSFLTTLFFSLSVLFAARSTRFLRTNAANLGRMTVAVALLALWAHTFGGGLRGASFPCFLISGCIGFGLGDIALFEAIPRIGPRLTILLAQCFAAPFGALIERLWLGTTLRISQLLWGAVILAGVAIAVAPAEHLHIGKRRLWAGVAFGVLSALGQGGGAVISRKAYSIASRTGFIIDGGTAAYQRMLGGIVVAGLFYLFHGWSRARRSGSANVEAANPRPQRTVWIWVALNGLAGPTIGVACYQWALSNTPSGIVLPIVAATPIVTIPLAYLINGDRPTRRSVAGGIVAVAGAVGLALA